MAVVSADGSRRTEEIKSPAGCYSDHDSHEYFNDNRAPALPEKALSNIVLWNIVFGILIVHHGPRC